MECPVLWCGKLQTKIDLNKTEAEIISLIQAMRNVIPFMALMKETSCILNIHLPKPQVFCKVFEDKQSCIAVAKSNFFTKNKTYCY